MANEIKKITAAEFEAAVNKKYKPTATIMWNGLAVVTLVHLGLDQMRNFVNGVADSCFEELTGDYMPEVRDYAMRSAMVRNYTNIELPEDHEKRYELLMHSYICQAIMDVIDKDQFNAMMDAVDERINNELDLQTAELNTKLKEVEDMVSSINAFIQSVSESLSPEAMDELVKTLGANAADSGSGQPELEVVK